jgi:hypothetical protein
MEQTARQKTPTFLTLEELSRRMGMSMAWVYKYATRLGGVKLGGIWVFTAPSMSRADTGRVNAHFESQEWDCSGNGETMRIVSRNNSASVMDSTHKLFPIDQLP